ncbi:ROK family transcriptional regulator [Alicyclobacillus dauci]|uniref:ROK family transcriptional regulator n=1 Tax=Alicyclobacillus dauci TaxID=1475485 RepID=A0ABY6YXD1_9BACL|nr:ROK family transcriptional regulator [Alicyclobacillus dauci]WAH35254.1 ROK family transcriptional regulator [Alicyclobacillus dauci]
MTRTADPAFMKATNKHIVLDKIRFHSPISRAQISAETGLNKATVSALIDELIQEGLAIEVGHGQSRVGRRPIMLLFNEQVANVLGVELGVEYIRIVVTNLAAKVLKTYDFELPHHMDPTGVIETVMSAVHEAIADAPPSKHGIIGIGIGVPGLVDYHRGIVLKAPHLNWDNVPIKAMLETRFGKPVFVDNEANAGALGEKMYGVGTNVENLLYISAGTGIGTGIVLHNELLRGADGVAGEYGHMSIDLNGAKCLCGNHGCWELYASERALVANFEKLTGRQTDFKSIVASLENSDPAALQAFRSVGQYLGIGATNLINGLNPSMVILGNRLARGGKCVLDGLQHVIQTRCFIAPYSKLSVQVSALGRDACPVGAAALVLHDFFAGPKAEV